MRPGIGVGLTELLDWAENFSAGSWSPIDSLAASLFVPDPSPGSRIMAMFTAYFDAAGNGKDQPLVVVSGYVANYFQWRALENLWAEIHSEYGVNIPFHAAEFMAAHTNPKYRDQKNARQDYVSLAQDRARSGEFFKHICVAQQTTVNCGISCIVSMEVYRGANSLFDLRKVVPPYALAARSCMAYVHEWEDQFNVHDPVECIFEEGDFEQGRLTDLIVSEGGTIPIYKKKAAYAGLQAADHYAWEHYHHLKNELREQAATFRGAFRSLLNAIPKKHIEVTPEGLVNLCHSKHIDPRTGVRLDKA